MTAHEGTYQKYAQLLVDYCLALKAGESVLIKSSYLAVPLLKPLYAAIIKTGAHCELDLHFEDQDKLFYENAAEKQLQHVSPRYKTVIDSYQAIIHVRAPFDLYGLKDIPSEKKIKRSEAMSETKKVMMSRSQTGDIRWVLCEFPTQAAAEGCGMNLDEYSDFIFQSCFLKEDRPVEHWQVLSKTQDEIVNRLMRYDRFTFIKEKTKLHFSTKDRLWINSDGKRNMPSGEVFTSPVEDSVNGTIFFNYPTRYQGRDVENVTLTVKDGYVTDWHADIGQEALDEAFEIKGSRYFGEVAIGTNPNIQRATKNILFDEKIGGSIHMAVGSSYPETGGKNESALHWDLITDMKNGGQILANETLIYENGKFI